MPKNKFYLSKECFKGSTLSQVLCFMDSIEGSPRYRGGSCVICTGQAITVFTDEL